MTGVVGAANLGVTQHTARDGSPTMNAKQASNNSVTHGTDELAQVAHVIVRSTTNMGSLLLQSHATRPGYVAVEYADNTLSVVEVDLPVEALEDLASWTERDLSGPVAPSVRVTGRAFRGSLVGVLLAGRDERGLFLRVAADDVIRTVTVDAEDLPVLATGLRVLAAVEMAAAS